MRRFFELTLFEVLEESDELRPLELSSITFLGIGGVCGELYSFLSTEIILSELSFT